MVRSFDRAMVLALQVDEQLPTLVRVSTLVHSSVCCGRHGLTQKSRLVVVGGMLIEHTPPLRLLLCDPCRLCLEGTLATHRAAPSFGGRFAKNPSPNLSSDQEHRCQSAPPIVPATPERLERRISAWSHLRVYGIPANPLSIDPVCESNIAYRSLLRVVEMQQWQPHFQHVLPGAQRRDR